MAIQIWDAQAGQYKSADLARFGGSGTLTEALVWDGTQYVKVWSATITITPQAPTFLTESPWYTLPTVAGVTYTVSGTPGYGQSVTVTATPQAGYELAGQTSWTHTYGPPPSLYPFTGGIWVDRAEAGGETYFSHTVEGARAVDVTVTTTTTDTSGYVYPVTRVNGSAHYGPFGGALTVRAQPGDFVQVQAEGDAAGVDVAWEFDLATP